MASLSPTAIQPQDTVSQMAMRLARRIGLLIERTLDLYEHDLAAAEAATGAEPLSPEPAPESDPAPDPEHETAPASAPRTRSTSGSAPRLPRFSNDTLSLLHQLKSLTRSMETLARIAKITEKLSDPPGSRDEYCTLEALHYLAPFAGNEKDLAIAKYRLDIKRLLRKHRPTIETYDLDWPDTPAP